MILNNDLAELYEVETKQINEQVKRNRDLFPEDFMFQRSQREYENLKSQIATSSWGGRRKLPDVFTKHGVLMLSSALNSSKARQVNITILWVLSRMCTAMLDNEAVLNKIELLEKQTFQNSEDNQYVFTVIKKLIQKAPEPRKRMGFKA